MEITKEVMKSIVEEAKKATNTTEVRNAIFNHCKRTDIVPDNFLNAMRAVTRHCYSTVSHYTDEEGNTITYHNSGYDGIMAEVDDRIAMKVDNGDIITVNDFFKAKADETDLYDSFRKKSYEKKTGTGTWLYGDGSFDEIVKKYRRKRKLLMWDYEHTPTLGRKQDYPIDIHICTTYKLFFDFLSTYKGGIQTFFKYKKGRSEKAGTNLYDIQTIHSSKVKIAFLESFDEWLFEQGNK